MSIDAAVLIEREIVRKAKHAAAILAPAQTLKVPLLLADHIEPQAPSVTSILTAILEKRTSSRRALKDLLVLFEWPKDDLVGNDNLLQDQSLVPAMRSSLAVQRQAWQLCQHSGIRSFSCMPVRAHADLFSDPWQSLSESIRWWHSLAGKLKDAVAQDSGDEIVMVLTDWSAATKGVEYSLKYIGAPKQRVISMFSGKKVPVSQVKRQQILASAAGDNLPGSEYAKAGLAEYTYQL